MPLHNRLIRSVLGHQGVALLMLVVFGLCVISANSKKAPDQVSLSMDFKSLRKLEYQEWVSRNSPADFSDLDELGANYIKDKGPEPIFIKALPFSYSAEVGQRLSYRIEFSSSPQAPLFLMADTERARHLHEVNKALLNSHLANIQSDWGLVEINGQSIGQYLQVTWPLLNQPITLTWDEFDKNHLQKAPRPSDLEIEKIAEKIDPQEAKSGLLVVGTNQAGLFQPAYIIYSDLVD